MNKQIIFHEVTKEFVRANGTRFYLFQLKKGAYEPLNMDFCIYNHLKDTFCLVGHDFSLDEPDLIAIFEVHSPVYR